MNKLPLTEKAHPAASSPYHALLFPENTQYTPLAMMDRFRWHMVPLLLVAFLYFLAISTAQEAAIQDVGDQAPLRNSKASASASVEAQRHDRNEVDEEARNRVREATSILRRIETPTVSKFWRYTHRPKGLFGSSVYYAKQAFVLLFMNGPQQANLITTSSTPSTTKLAQPLSKAVKLLQNAATANDPDAIYLLAEMNFFGNYSHPINYQEAFNRYEQLADFDGNSTAQYMLGFMYGTGLNPSVPTDIAKSMLYHTFAAEQGNTRSEMTLAYRNHAGIGTAKDCDEAVHWYKKVADKAVRYYRSGPPGGHVLVRDAYRLADEDGGVYGEGASVSSAGLNAKQGGPTSDVYASIDDVLEFLHMQSAKGELKATFGIARVHYDGARGLKRDLKLAKDYFLSIARRVWDTKGKVAKDVHPADEKMATKAAGYLGRMFLRGEGLERNYDIAKIWFTRGISNGDALSQYSMGLMYLEGLGVDQNVEKAAKYFAAAADQDLPVAQTHLGVLFLDQGDTRTATKYFELAAHNGHIEAFYYLAEMNNKAIGRDRTCGSAAHGYKIVAEKAEAIWSSLAEANDAFDDGDTQKALIGYLMAAEQGSENAQANVAWLLDQTQSRWSPSRFLTSLHTQAKSSLRDAALSLIYWTRSAKQSNMDSLVKMGDYYLLGLGSALSPENAAACYQAASDAGVSAQAMWNLGWMHENGVGIEQDFHLAKRFYDQALATNPKEAYASVKLSLWRLRWRSWWNKVTRGNIHGIEEDADEDGGSRPRSLMEWFHDFVEADEEQMRRLYGEALAGEEGEFGAADDYDGGGMPGGDITGEDIDLEDDLLELLLIAGLVATLAWLLWYRGQQQQRAAEERRRQEQVAGAQAGAAPPPGAPGQQADGGFFPPRDDPNFNAWVAGGVGH